jgi:hypothetical protein
MGNVCGLGLLWIWRVPCVARRRCTGLDAAFLLADFDFALLACLVADDVICRTFGLVSITADSAAGFVGQVSHVIVFRIHPKASFAIEELASHVTAVII